MANFRANSPIRCLCCDHYLSVFPIYQYKTGFVCGRNLHPNVPKTNRQVLFERLAKNQLFGCSYDKYGCKVQIKSDNVNKHEMKCTFAPFECPVQCGWTGVQKSFVNHVKEKHSNLILNKPQIQLSNLGNLIYFTTVSSNIITNVIRVLADKAYFLLLIDEDEVKSQNYYFNLDVCEENVENHIQLKKHRLYPIKQYQQITLDAYCMFEINKSLHIFDNINQVFCKCLIHKRINNDESDIVSSAKPGSVVESIRSELDCPVCEEYMKPPIYICQIGHNICQNCRKRIELCPICRGSMGDGRNYTLEKLSEKVVSFCDTKTQ